MPDTNDHKSYQIPSIMAELEWVWVLTSPITKHRDSILVIEMGDEGKTRQVIPLFDDRQSAVALKSKFAKDNNIDYVEQAMKLSEVGQLAAKQNFEMMLLDATGRILAHMEAQIEESSIH